MKEMLNCQVPPAARQFPYNRSTIKTVITHAKCTSHRVSVLPLSKSFLGYYSKVSLHVLCLYSGVPIARSLCSYKYHKDDLPMQRRFYGGITMSLSRVDIQWRQYM